MNLLSVLSAMAFTIYMFIGIYGFNLNRKSIINKLFLALCICFGAWAFAFIFIYPRFFGDTVWHWAIDKVGAFGWCTYYGVVLHLVFVMTGKERYTDNIIKKTIIYIPGAVLLIADMIAFAPGVIQTKRALNIFAISSFIVSTTYVLSSFIMLYLWGRKTKVGKEKKQAKIIIVTGLTSFSLSVVFQSIFPMFGLPTAFVAQIYSLIWTFGVFIAITRYKLFVLNSTYAAEHILSKIKDIVILLDTKGRIIYANQQLENILGYTLKDIQYYEYNTLFLNPLESCKEKQSGVCIDSIGNGIDVEVVFEEVFDKEGDFVGTSIIVSDVRERRKLEKEIEERTQVESSLHNLVENNLLIQNSRDAIFVYSESKIIFANDSAVKLLGYTKAEELNGKGFLEIIPTDIHERTSERIKKLYEKKTSVEKFDMRVLMLEGDIIDVENTSIYIVYEGKPTIISIFRDKTPEKQVELLKQDIEQNKRLLKETREMNKLITDFFSNVSHELRTPLNVIYAALQTLRLYNEDGIENSKKRDNYYDMMHQNCYRLMRLINNLLDLTRVDSGFLKPEFRNYNIVSVIEEVTLSVADYVQSKGLSLTFDTEAEEIIMACDRDKIERIMLNLISNAVKFTNTDGRIEVYVWEEDYSVKITVIDTGVGIPEEKIQIIFDRFGQVDKTFTRNREGSGIGLSLVKSFVDMHNGDVEVNSELGKGSCFTISIPIVLVEQVYDEELSHEMNIDRINIEFSDIYGHAVD